MNAHEKKAAAERERSREQKKEQRLSMILDREGGNVAEMDALLIHSISRASTSADRLSRRILWLNVIIVVIGTLSLFVAGYAVFFK